MLIGPDGVENILLREMCGPGQHDDRCRPYFYELGSFFTSGICPEPDWRFSYWLVSFFFCWTAFVVASAKAVLVDERDTQRAVFCQAYLCAIALRRLNDRHFERVCNLLRQRLPEEGLSNVIPLGYYEYVTDSSFSDLGSGTAITSLAIRVSMMATVLQLERRIWLAAIRQFAFFRCRWQTRWQCSCVRFATARIFASRFPMDDFSFASI